MHVRQVFGQGLAYLAFGLVVAALSTLPRYAAHPEDKALIKLSLTHAGVRKGECRRLSSAEIAALPPSQRRPMDCGRERAPVALVFEVDGNVLFDQILPPSGLARDGVSQAYERFTVSPGTHHLSAKLRDADHEDGFDVVGSVTVALEPRQNFVVDFDSAGRVFTFR